MSVRTPAHIEEQVWAAYQDCCNCAEVARKFKMPRMTVWEIVERLGGDALVRVRTAHRARAIEEAWETVREANNKARKLIRRTESADEAARVGVNVAKSADMMRSRSEADKPQEPIELIVKHIGLEPKKEPPQEAQDSTLPKPG